MTEDGQALVMLKNGTIGITGLMMGCPNGVQTPPGSRISINGKPDPTSQNVISRRDSGLLRWKSDRRWKPLSHKGVHGPFYRHLCRNGIQLFRGDMLKVCPKFVTSLCRFFPETDDHITLKIPSS